MVSRAALRSTGFLILFVFASTILGLSWARGLKAEADDNDSISVYVSANDGNDSWSGKLASPNSSKTDGPLATMDRARIVVESIDKSKANEVDVIFREGTYQLPDEVAFNSKDSGTSHTEVVYESYPNEHPVFSGGMRVQGWSNTDGNIWVAKLPPTTQNFERRSSD